MIKSHSFTNIGSRNKGVMWEHLTACAYRDMEVPGSGYKLTKLLSFGENESNQHCLALDEIVSQTKLMIDECESGKYTSAFFERVREYYVVPFAELKKSVSAMNISKAASFELLELYDQFYISAGRTYPPMLIGFFSAYLDDYFTRALTKVVPLSGVDLIKVKTNLLTMPQVAFTEREDAAVADAVRLIKSSKLNIHAAAEKLARQYGWFHMEYVGNPRLADHYANLIEIRLAPDAPTVNITEAKKEVINFQNKFFTDYPNKRLQYITNAMQELSFILDDSKAYTIENHFVIYPVLEEIAHRLSCPVGDIYLLSQPELHDAVSKGSVNKNILAERRKYRAILLDGESLKVFTGREAKQIGEKYIEIPQVLTSDEIRGLVAYPGHYRGTVRLILNPHDHGKFKDGDVLVTRDGSAEFTYFLQHAGAVVCDQGGIISHAAIVARESKVPTILGTKVATKVLKDGDLVEVDAERGIVKIIQ